MEDLLPKVEPGMVRKITLDSIFLKDSMEECAPFPGDVGIQIKSLKEESCFRIKFSLPVLLHFHHATRNLRRVHVYFRSQSGTFPVGFIPSYNCNLNHLTLLRTYCKTQKWINIHESNEDEDYFCKLFDNSKSEPMEQSGLNFLLQNGSVPKPVSDTASRLVNDCFENHYWRPPQSDFRHSVMHDFIYHSHSKIFSMHGIYKTIVKIEDIGTKRYEMKESPRMTRYAHASARIMCQDDSDLFFSRSPIKLTISEPAASQLAPDDIASCIISKLLSKGSFQPPMIRGVIRKIDDYDLSQIISSVIWRRLQEVSKQSSVCRVGSIGHVKEMVSSLIKNSTDIFDDRWTDHFEHRMDDSLQKTYPTIFKHGDIIYHVPPPLVSYVLSRNIPVFENKNDLVDFLDFVDMIDPHMSFGNRTRLRTSEVAKKVQSGPCKSKWNLILKEIPRVANRVAYSRIFSKPIRV